jgi:hypothetical protein
MAVEDAIDAVATRARRAWSYPSWWNLLVVLPWVLGIAFLIQQSRTDRQVAGRQQTTSGTITAYDPGNHNQYGYKFEVAGRGYTGWESPKHDELAVGKEVVVYYDPQNPSRNSLTDFHDLSTTSLGPVPLLLFGIGAVGVFIAYMRRGRMAPEPNS